jgi:hypothetical protein
LYPVYKFRPDNPSVLQVLLDSKKSGGTQRLSQLDALAAKNLEENFLATITWEVLQVGIKGPILNAGTAGADVRSWRLLP